MKVSVDKIRPQAGWLLCQALDPSSKTASGLILAKDMDKDVVTEGVAVVLKAGPPPLSKKGGNPIDMQVKEGDKFIYRGFLRFAQALGDVVEESERHSQYFLMNYRDVLAVLDGEGSVGFYGEYQL